MRIRDIRLFTAVLAAMILIDAFWQPAVLLVARVFPTFFFADIAPIARGVDIAALVFKLVTMIAFATWLYLAGHNLVAAGFDDLEFTPASRIWWFFVPIASLFKPFQGMRELSNASDGIWPRDTNDSLVSAWWALWVINNGVGWATGMSAANSAGTTMIWISGAFDVASGIAAILLIRRIAMAQSQLHGTALVEVFA